MDDVELVDVSRAWTPEDLAALPLTSARHLGRSRCRFEVRLPERGAFLVKIYRPRSLRKALFSHERRGRAEREWTNAFRARRAGIPTVLPVGRARPAWSGDRREVIAYPFLAGARDLTSVLGSSRTSATQRIAALESAAWLMRIAHDRGLTIDDFPPGQVLFGVERRPVLVDLERAHWSERVGWPRRIRDLARFDRGLAEIERDHPRSASNGERLRFLLAYTEAGAPPIGRDAMVRWVRILSQASIRRRTGRRKRELAALQSAAPVTSIPLGLADGYLA